MAFPLAAALIPAATSIIGGILGNKGAKKQAQAQQRGLDEAAAARAQAERMLSPSQVGQVAQWLFPGLLQGSNPGVVSAVQGYQPLDSPKAGAKTSQGLVSNIFPTPRALGGPVEPGKPYLVGEKGPELLQTQADGSGAVAPLQVSASGAGGNQGSTVPAATLPAGQAGPVATYQAPSTGAFAPTSPSLGNLAVQHSLNFLQNPGQVSTTAYERAQEGANRDLLESQRALLGEFTGRGVDPTSGLGLMAQQAVIGGARQRKNEAARDLTTLEEQQRRQDISMGIQNYLNFLNTVFGYSQQRGAAASGGPFPQISNPVNPYQPLATGVATLGTFDWKNILGGGGGGQPSYTSGTGVPGTGGTRVM